MGSVENEPGRSSPREYVQGPSSNRNVRRRNGVALTTRADSGVFKWLWQHNSKAITQHLAALSGLVSLACDCAIVALSNLAAVFLHFDGNLTAPYATTAVASLVVAPVFVVVNFAFRTYEREWRCAGLHDAVVLGLAATVSTGATAILVVSSSLGWALPLSVVPVGGVLSLLGMGAIRFRHRLRQELFTVPGRAPRQPLLIIGAGHAGQRLARELLSNPALGYSPVCFVDDDPAKLNHRIHGLPVLGNRHRIPELVRRFRIDVIALAIPSLSNDQRRAVLSVCENCPALIKIVPGMPELLSGTKLDGAPFRDARLDDLLGRPPVVLLDGGTGAGIAGSVLITGACGSIGSELARQVTSAGAMRLILLDSNESGLFDLALELQTITSESRPRIDVVVADVRNAWRIEQVFAEHRPKVVFHVAAYKHVPLMELHPQEAVTTNVVGTANVCKAAEKAGCERVVFISTDKAVDPASVLGATKRVGEYIVRAFSASSSTIYCIVRFGNVLGSRGSVVPTFVRQLQHGGPLTITNAEATRYFMTIAEAASLIIVASQRAEGGELFILNMGTPVRIMDLARKMIRMHGLRPGQDIEIREVGLRPGEKVHETLVGGTERVIPTQDERMALVTDIGLQPERGRMLAAVEYLASLAESGSTQELTTALFDVVATAESAWANSESATSRLLQDQVASR
jgi:FlaA1/EpsC-like NDP-sugar epimerase